MKTTVLKATCTGAASAVFLLGCANLGSSNDKPAQLQASSGKALEQCEALASSFKFDNTSVDSVAAIAAGGLMQASQPVPSHCLVKGQMFKRKGSDGRDYAIGFEMRLPTNWNGRFYYQGNGGLDGSVQPALGALGGGPLTGALMQGFAVISSDAGHTGAQTAVFGAEPQARLDYGYQAVEKLTPMAKALIREAYGKAPDRSYIGGCSNGGRHVMVAMSRIGDQYDGYLAGAPGYRLPNAALAQLWGAQQWATVATAGATTPHPMSAQAPRIADLGTGFTPAERQTVANAILAKCDALDGIKDGMVMATQACQAAFDVKRDVPSCLQLNPAVGDRRDEAGRCLTAAQKEVLDRVFTGGVTSGDNGIQAIYSSFPHDIGVAGGDWAKWKFAFSLALDPLAVSTVFSTPPTPVSAMTVKADERLALFHATNEAHKVSGLALMTPPQHENPVNLAALKARGAKVMLYHGVSDPIFSAEDTRQWIERVNAAQGGVERGRDFARYFSVPGMNHCSGGPAVDQFDMLMPLVKWVEQGLAPDSVMATARGAGNAGGVNVELPKEWEASRSRPLCAYPKVAKYDGSGSVEDAARFSCL
jgi:feruloyl esterase